MAMTDAELADRLVRRRARLFPVLGILFLVQQGAYWSQGQAGRTVDHIRLGAWAAMGLALLFALITGGSVFRRREVRAMVNDEGARANRASALEAGFIAAMLAGIALYCLQGWTAYSAGEALHLVVSAGLVVAMVRFGMLERRDLA